MTSSRRKLYVFKGGPLDGERRLKTDPGRNPIHLDNTGAPMRAATGDRIVALTNVHRIDGDRTAYHCFGYTYDATTGDQLFSYRHTTDLTNVKDARTDAIRAELAAALGQTTAYRPEAEEAVTPDQDDDLFDNLGSID